MKYRKRGSRYKGNQFRTDVEPDDQLECLDCGFQVNPRGELLLECPNCGSTNEPLYLVPVEDRVGCTRLFRLHIAKYEKAVIAKGLPFNVYQRYAILKRDDFRCQSCGISVHDNPDVRLEVDHIIPRRRGGDNSLENGQTLCSTCNLGKHVE